MWRRRGDQLLRDLDWNLLHTFTIIVEEESITRAAERLLLRQPTVSNALKRLETYVGARLLERRQGGLELTEEGRRVYEEAREIRDHVRALAERVQPERSEVTGQVAVAMASHVVFPPFDALLSRFHDRYPGVTFSVDVMYSREVQRAVLDRRATLGICLVHKQLSRLEYRRLYREHFGFFCGPRHRFYGRRDLSLADLRQETFVSFRTDQLTDALRPIALLRAEANLEGRIVGVSSHLEEVRRMIIAGLGIGPLPVHVVERDVRDGRLWQLPPYEDPPAIDIFVVTNPRMRWSQAERLFADALTEMIAGLDETESVMAGQIAV